MVTKFTRLEFSEVCKIPNNTLTIHAKRGKIAINSSRCDRCREKRKPCDNCRALEFIDLDYRTKEGFYINMDFFKKATEGLAPVKYPKAPKPPKEKEKPKPAISSQVIVSRETANNELEDKDEFEDLSENSSDDRLTRAKKFREIQNKEADTRLKELQEAKLTGELIPIEIVRDIIQFLGENQKRAYSDSGENLIMLISDRLNAQEHDKAFMRTKLLEGMNRAINQSVNESQEKLTQFLPDEL